MAVILYSQLMFGNLFVIRTLQIFQERALLNTTTLTKIGTTSACASALICFFCAHNAILASGLTVTAIFFAIACLFFCERRQIDAFKSEIAPFLDRWILNLRLGSALPSARESALLEQTDGFQNLLRPLFSARNTPPSKRQHLLFTAPVLSELERLQKEPHAALARLENLRSMLRHSSEFRRKSGQAVRQTQIQSSVMLLLLFALTFFTLYRYGWKRTSDIVLGAVGLSILGVVSMHYLARKSQWKI